MDIVHSLCGHGNIFHHRLSVLLDDLSISIPLWDGLPMLQQPIIKLLDHFCIEPRKFNISHSWSDMQINRFLIRIKSRFFDPLVIFPKPYYGPFTDCHSVRGCIGARVQRDSYRLQLLPHFLLCAAINGPLHLLSSARVSALGVARFPIGVRLPITSHRLFADGPSALRVAATCFLCHRSSPPFLLPIFY